jgi:Fe-Mn family superoxide dismutase
MISAEDVRAMRSTGRPIHIIDVRPRHYLLESREMIEGAVRRDPERVDEWVHEVPTDGLVVAVCAFGRQIGQDTASALRAAGLDAHCMAGGHAAWKAIDGPVVPLRETPRAGELLGSEGDEGIDAGGAAGR